MWGEPVSEGNSVLLYETWGVMDEERFIPVHLDPVVYEGSS